MKMGLSGQNKSRLVWNFIVQIAAANPNEYLNTNNAMRNIKDVISPDIGLAKFLSRLFYENGSDFKEALLLLCKTKEGYAQVLCEAFCDKDEIDRLSMMISMVLTQEYCLSRRQYNFLRKFNALFRNKTNGAFNFMLPYHNTKYC
eukprot:706575_1